MSRSEVYTSAPDAHRAACDFRIVCSSVPIKIFLKHTDVLKVKLAHLVKLKIYFVLVQLRIVQNLKRMTFRRVYVEHIK